MANLSQVNTLLQILSAVFRFYEFTGERPPEDQYNKGTCESRKMKVVFIQTGGKQLLKCYLQVTFLNSSKSSVETEPLSTQCMATLLRITSRHVTLYTTILHELEGASSTTDTEAPPPSCV